MPDVCTVRRRLADLLDEASRRGADVVVLAVDGVPFGLASELLTGAQVEQLRSVFPPTSSTSWLSSLTGDSVADHGVPGVVFRLSPGQVPVHVFSHLGPLDGPRWENVFTDAAARGFDPCAVVGDLGQLACTWREVLLRGARRFAGPGFYATGDGDVDKGPRAHEVVTQIAREVRACLDADRVGQPRLVWCFVDLDLYIHRFGYDSHVERVLILLDTLAVELSDRAVVALHSDHGLVETSHASHLAAVVARLLEELAISMGGAGRCRWFYADPEHRELLSSRLAPLIVPHNIVLVDPDDLFPRGSLARARVGDVMMVSEGTAALAPPHYRFDHGSLRDVELDVPFAVWR